jgi:hypothetical protein
MQNQCDMAEGCLSTSGETGDFCFAGVFKPMGWTMVPAATVASTKVA